jgi:hypothetical protein
LTCARSRPVSACGWTDPRYAAELYVAQRYTRPPDSRLIRMPDLEQAHNVDDVGRAVLLAALVGQWSQGHSLACGCERASSAARAACNGASRLVSASDPILTGWVVKSCSEPRL